MAFSKTKLYVLFIVLISSCFPRPEDQIKPTVLSLPKAVETARFDVRIEQVIQDNLAYEDKRGIYIITDLTTGKEYLGISGIGISELGSHYAGSNTVYQDER